MINIIVGMITIIAFGFIVLWILRPSFRKWVEQPKYTMLENDRRFRLQEKGDSR
jgi:ABC-type phosphate transport system permease subunit